jgi:hypothetical protein
MIADACGVTVDWLLGRSDSAGQNTLSGTSCHPCQEVEKGQKGACRYPENCDLPKELSVLRERMDGIETKVGNIEDRLDHMGVQLETLCGLLGHALGNTLTADGKTKKAG